MTRRRIPGIGTTAIGILGYGVGYGATLGFVGGLVIGLGFSFYDPRIVLFVLLFSIPLGGAFGLLVGIVTGLVLAVLVVIGDRRNAQVRVADLMPWIAVLIANGMTLLAFASWSPLALIALTQMCSLALAFFGGTRIARAYLRAEEPRVRQLIH